MTAPFGIELNQQLVEHLIVRDAGQSKFAINPPKPHPSFSEYYAQNSRSFGVVWLKGVSATFENDAYGSSAQSLLDKISAQLQTRYGRPKKTDFLKQGAIWEDDRDWVMSLVQNERFFFHHWDRNNNADLPDDMESIFLGIVAYDSSTCAVGLEYTSIHANHAESEVDQDLSDLL